jgi:hypothetical protein
MELDADSVAWINIEDISNFTFSINEAELMQIENTTDITVRNYELEVLMIYPIGMFVLACLLPYLMPKVIASIQPAAIPDVLPVLPTH